MTSAAVQLDSQSPAALLLDDLTFLEVDLLQIPADAGSHLHEVDRFQAAGSE